MKRVLRKIGKIFGWSLFCLLSLVFVLVIGAIILLRTHFGQQKLLAFVVPKIQESLQGTLKIQNFRTDVFHQIVLEKISLSDAQGNPAVYLDYLEINYQLKDLLHKKLHITKVVSTGGKIHARLLSDGKLNLTTLTKPSEKETKIPITIQIDSIEDQNEIFYDPPAAITKEPTHEEKQDEDEDIEDQALQSPWIEQMNQKDSKTSDQNKQIHHKTESTQKINSTHKNHVLQKELPPLKTVQKTDSIVTHKEVMHKAISMSASSNLDRNKIVTKREVTNKIADGPFVEQAEEEKKNEKKVPDLTTLPAHAHLVITGKVFVTNEQLNIDDLHLAIQVTEPAQVQIDFQGGIHKYLKDLQIIDHRLKITTQAEEFQPFVPTLPIAGPLALLVQLSGSLSTLHTSVVLSLPKGEISLQAQLDSLLTTLGWQVTLQAKDVDLSALSAKVPQSQIQLLVKGQGQKAKGTVSLEQLLVSGLKAQVMAKGEATFDKDQISQAKAELLAQVPVLAKLTPFIHKPLFGAVTVKVSAQKQENHVKGEANIQGEKLKMEDISIGSLDFSAQIADFSLVSPQAFLASISATVKKLRVQELRFDHIGLQAKGNQGQINLAIAGQGPQHTSFRLGLDGFIKSQGQVPQGAADLAHVTELEAFLTELTLAKAGQRFALRQPAKITVAPLAQPNISIENFSFASGRQQIKLDAQYHTAAKTFLAKVGLSHINAYRMLALIQRHPQVPQTDINAAVSAKGSVKRPYAQVSLSGLVKNSAKLPIGDTNVKLQAQLSPHHLQGTLSVKGQGPTAEASFALPLSQKGPVQLHVLAQSELQPFRNFFPAQMKTLQGKVFVKADAEGTINKPHLDVKVGIPNVIWQKLQVKNTQLQLQYQPKQFSFSLATELANQTGLQLGRSQIKIDAPLDINPKASWAKLKPMLLALPWKLTGNISSVRLKPLMLLFKPDSPLQDGLFESQFEWTGSVKDPKFIWNVQATHIVLQTPQLKKKPIDLDVGFVYENNQADLVLNTKINRQNLLQGRVTTPIALADVLQKGKAFLWKELPITANITMLPYHLDQFLPIRGILSAHAGFSGSLKHPKAEFSLLGQQLGAEDFDFGGLRMDAHFSEGKGVDAQVKAEQKNGSLLLDVKIPGMTLQNVTPALIKEKLNLRFLAKNYILQYQPKQESALFLKTLRGTINADLHLQGLEKEPTGSVRIQKGAIAFATDPRLYENIELDVSIAPKGAGSQISLKQAGVTTALGTAKASGQAYVEKMKPKSVNLNLESHKFPISAGPIGLWLDSKVQVKGEQKEDGVFTADITIPSGKIELPALTSTRSVQSLEPLEEQIYVDAKNQEQVQKFLTSSDPKELIRASKALRDAEKEATSSTKSPSEQREERQANKEPEQKSKLAQSSAKGSGQAFQAKVTAKTTNAIYVRGTEVNAEVTAKGSIEIGKTETPKIMATVQVSPGGRIEFLGKRYDIQKAKISLGGEIPPNPIVDVEISRKITNTTLYITVSGTVNKPQVHFRSEPPIYDESKILAILVLGDPQDSDDQNQQLSGKAIGFLSGLILGQFQQEIAKTIGLDTLKFETGGGASGVERTRIEAGKYITNDIYMSYIHQFGAQNNTLRKQNSDEVRLEYRLPYNLRLDMRYGTAGVGGLGFSWSRRFK